MSIHNSSSTIGACIPHDPVAQMLEANRSPVKLTAPSGPFRTGLLGLCSYWRAASLKIFSQAISQSLLLKAICKTFNHSFGENIMPVAKLTYLDKSELYVGNKGDNEEDFWAAEANRRHFETWLKPRSLQRREKDKELARANIDRQLGGALHDQDEYLQYIEDRIYNGTPTINIPSSVVANFKSDQVRNMWGTGIFEESEGRGRDQVEKILFQYGISPDEAVKNYALRDFNGMKNEKFNSNSRPIYAAVSMREDDKGRRPGGAPGYGNAAFFFKKSRKKICHRYWSR
ncbi:hypothetical protein DF143_35245 [Burkholderia cenocepacia]|nr:hypothetical protein DF143_35245 [Burkholderia cenocepacia]RQV33472.1 hypothetical protein DF033_34645 [Burkholderia cenocepacia]